MKTLRINNGKWQNILFSLFFLVLCYQVFIPPFIGNANNGDYERMMGWFGLRYLDANYFEHLNAYLISTFHFHFENRYYYFKNYGHVYYSSELILIKIALWLNSAFSKAKISVFDIRYLGFTHATFFILGLWLWYNSLHKNENHFRKKAASIGLVLGGLLFFDVGYLNYLNTLYSEAASLVFFLSFVGVSFSFFLQERPSIKWLALFFISSTLFVTAKIQNTPIGFLIAIFGIRLSFLRNDWQWKASIIFFSILLFSGSFALYRSNTQPISQMNEFNSVFTGITKYSKHAAQDLIELGVSPSYATKYAILAGREVFQENHPIDINGSEFQTEFYEKITHAKIVRFYLNHPPLLLEKMKISAENAFEVRVKGLGNFEESAGFGPFSQAVFFPTGEKIRHFFYPRRLIFIVSFFAILLATLALKWKNEKHQPNKALIEWIAILGIMGASQFIVPILGDGEGALAKHLFLFNLIFDALLVICTSYAVASIHERSSKFLHR